MDQFNTLNRQQQPFIQSGYGAMGKLNTLLGLGGRPQAGPSPMPVGGAAPRMSGDHMFRPMLPGGSGMTSAPKTPPMAPMGGGNARLAQLLSLRARNGDTEAARMLGMI